LAEEISVPFSARNRGASAQIDNACPESTRIGLLHILRELIERNYIAGWPNVVRELERIGRLRPEQCYNNPEGADQALAQLEWDKVFDFCERLYSHLAQDVYHGDNFGPPELTTPRSEVQKYIAAELQRLFVEEHLTFEFSNGLVRRRGSRNTAEQIGRGEFILSDPRLSEARKHYNKALRYFRDVSKPDYENVVKEAVCAVESTAIELLHTGGSTLDDVLKVITGAGEGELPKAIAKTFEALYGFRNGGKGVSHGSATGGAVTKDLAEYALAVAASQIVLLFNLAAELDKPPF